MIFPKILWKEAFSNIWAKRLSWLSVVMISLLSVNAYLGIAFGAHALNLAASAFLHERSFQDIGVYTSSPLIETDIDALLACEGVTDAEGFFAVNADTEIASEKKGVIVQSVPERINMPLLVSGRMPAADNECVAELFMVEEYGIKEGDRLYLKMSPGTEGALKHDALLITGIIKHPEHLSYDLPVVPFVLVQKEAFHDLFADSGFMCAAVRCDSGTTDRFSESYFDDVERVLRRIEQTDEARKGEWTLLDNRSNGGYLLVSDNTGRLDALSMSLSLLFLAVAVQVVFTSTGRMIEDQRGLVGASKAMGITNREILLKYITFGFTATFLGALAGIAVAFFLYQRLVILVYSGFYIVDPARLVFLPVPAISILCGSLVLSVISVLAACRRLLSSSPVSLIKGGITLKKKKQTASAGRANNLYTRLIIGNILSDLKRVIAATVSVTGCCVLLMIGFILKFAVDATPAHQYSQIQHYDMMLFFEPETDAKQILASVLENKGTESTALFYSHMSYRIGNTMNAVRLICAEEGVSDTFFERRDMETGQNVPIPGEGFLTAHHFSEMYGLHPGDSFEISDDGIRFREAVVSSVYDQYIDEVMFCSPVFFEELFGYPARENCFFIKLNGLPPEELMEAVSETEGFVSLQDANESAKLFEQLSDALSVLVVLMIAMAGMLAYFVLLNLSDMYAKMRLPELNIMRANGFTLKECVLYASVEIVVTTLTGIVFGLIVGAFAGLGIERVIEQPGLRFLREADIRAFVFSAFITFCFSALVNGYSLLKLRNMRIPGASLLA